MRHGLFVHSLPGICYGELHIVALLQHFQTGRSINTDGDIIGLQYQGSPPGHGIFGVDHQIQYHLIHLMGICSDYIVLRFESQLDIDIFADETMEHFDHVADNCVERDRRYRKHLPAAERQKLPSQVGCAHRGLLYLAEISLIPGGNLRFAQTDVTDAGNVVVVLDVPYLFEKAGSAPDSDTRLTEKKRPDTRAASHRVLVVDDSLAARTLQKNILLDAGCEVSTAEDGEAAWNLLAQQTFDLLVSDVDMPKLDGLALTRRVRSSEQIRDLPVILITSLDSPEQRAAGANAGADEYIVKGTFDQRELSEVIARYF